MVASTELAALRPGERPEWVGEVDRLARTVPSATLTDAARMLDTRSPTLVRWLHHFGCDALVMRLRRHKSPLAWVALIEEALGRDDTLTLSGVAALYGRSEEGIRRAILAAGRNDLCDRLSVRSHRRHASAPPQQPKPVRELANLDWLRFPRPGLPGWIAVVEAALIGYPKLTLPELARGIDRDVETICEALLLAHRKDLLDQLLDNNLSRADHDGREVA